MDKQKKQSVIPIYAVGLVWLSRAISGNLSSFGQIIKTVILSVVTYGVLRIFFPDKIKQADPETRKMINEILNYPEDSAGSIKNPSRSRKRKSRTSRLPETPSWTRF